jgi:hypothetical protein
MLRLLASPIFRIVFLGCIVGISATAAFGQIKENATSCKAMNPGPASAQLARAMKIPAREIDPSLLSQCIADWLMDTFGTNNFAWGLSDCEKSVIGKASANGDTPKCLIADGSTTSDVVLHVKIRVGTSANWISGKPVLKAANVSGCGRSKEIGALNELKAAVQYVNGGCEK